MNNKEKPIPKIGEVPMNMVINYIKFYQPQLHEAYLKSVSFPFETITSKTKYGALLILLVMNLLGIGSLFHQFYLLRTIGFLMSILASIGILLVTLTPVDDTKRTNHRQKSIIRQYINTYQECESKIIAKITENILIIKSILTSEDHPEYKRKRLANFYNEAENEVEKELIVYSMTLLNQDLKLY